MYLSVFQLEILDFLNKLNDKKLRLDFEPCLTELLVQLSDEVTDEHFEASDAKSVLRQIVRE